MRLVRRLLIVWLIETPALWLLAVILPGIQVADWRAAALGVAVLGLLNALVRPVLLFLTLPFTVLSFGLLTLVLNALMLVAAGQLVPGLDVSGLWSPLLGALGIATINTTVTGVLALNDEDSFYRNVIRRIARRSLPRGEIGEPGLVLIEIDGLAAPTLERAIEAGLMPTLARWLREGSHRVVSWDCGIPSQTSSCQAGILYGYNFDIPAFRWYEKERGRLLVSNHPPDAAEIDRRVSTGNGLLHSHGSSLNNLLSGDAPRTVLTMSTFARGLSLRRSADFYLYFLNPYNFVRAFALMVWEILVELWEGWHQRLRDVQPRVSRGRSFPLLRAVSTILLRELSVYLLIEDMFAGVAVAYSTFVGYDVVAHHAGPERPDALRILHHLDRQIALLERAARHAPRPYHFVVLSDHGQSQGAPFRQRYGLTLEALVQSLLRGERSVQTSAGQGEAWGHLNAVLSEAIQPEVRAARAARRVLQRRARDGYVAVGPERDGVTEPAEVVVCASGNLGLIYFTAIPGRLTLETITTLYPGLIEGLVNHEGIGFVFVRSERHGPLALGRDGIHYLARREVEGDDPLGPFGPMAAHHLQRLDAFPHVGDLVVNSCFISETGEVAAFEELVGSHGGLGGPQTTPFLLFPSAWELNDPLIVGATEIYPVLRAWRDRLQGVMPVAPEMESEVADRL